MLLAVVQFSNVVNVYVCVCMHVCMCVCMCVRVRVRVQCAPAFKTAFECVHQAESSEQRFQCKPLMEAMAACVRDNRSEYASYAKQLDEIDAKMKQPPAH